MRDDDKLEATLLKKFHRESYYGSRAVPIQVAAQLGMASDEIGRAKDLIHERASSGSSLFQYQQHQETVSLETDLEAVGKRIADLTQPDNVPYDLQDYLDR